ncbi:iron chelate uptake ABC transporter family permease subunit, partial [Variovorax sp. CT11-76]
MRRATDGRRASTTTVWLVLLLLLAAAVVLALSVGAATVWPTQWWGTGTLQAELVRVWRAPRVAGAFFVGACLSLAGLVFQGVFRNPLADPGLVGISSGAALAAGVTIVLGAWFMPLLPRTLGSWTLVVMAFGGGLSVTLLIYALSRSEGGTRMALMLLAGIAVNALAGAGLGFLSVMATDEQLRSLQFWLLGSLGGARWSAVILVGVAVLLACVAAASLAAPLNAIALGESQAALLGVDVERIKRRAIVVTAVAVGAVTATTGIIGFIGLIAPHWVRMVAGPDHRVVLPASALLGAPPCRPPAPAPRVLNTLSGGEKARVHMARVLARLWHPRADGAARWLLL